MTYEVYAIRYAVSGPRLPHENFISPDPHEQASALDYFVWLIRGAGRDILVDTGFGEAQARARKRNLLIDPAEALRKLGVAPDSIREVVVTHLHYDHAGNLGSFPNARFHLQDREMRYATGRCMGHGLLRHPFAVEDVVTMVRYAYAERVAFHDGDGEVAADITVHRVGGHSDGLQVVRVATRRGPVVIASDATHFYANMARRNSFPIVYNVGDMMEGWQTVARLAGDPDRIIPGHDPAVCTLYPNTGGDVQAFALHVPPQISVSPELAGT
jgi:glyoxylase-like metal-dependent hydrolase (beta-lactamase superfamily II)